MPGVRTRWVMVYSLPGVRGDKLPTMVHLSTLLPLLLLLHLASPLHLPSPPNGTFRAAVYEHVLVEPMECKERTCSREEAIAAMEVLLLLLLLLLFHPLSLPLPSSSPR